MSLQRGFAAPYTEPTPRTPPEGDLPDRASYHRPACDKSPRPSRDRFTSSITTRTLLLS